jgi:serine/threonine-protein kinase
MGGYDSLAEGHILLGKYRIVRKVGEGGMAFIYQAFSQGAGGFERPVVIKVIRPELARNREMVNQFVREASVGANLDHPNIVNVFDLGEHEGMLYIIMEYVAGRDLAALIQCARGARRVLGPEIVAFICVDVCKALECSHGYINDEGHPAPIIHRDVSPQNILLSRDGDAQLADFGMARALGTARVTAQGVLKGKLSYMAPEQSRGKEVDARADLFSLGVVLWESLTGRRLFLGENPTETIKRVRACQPPPLHKVAPHVPEKLRTIVHRLLLVEPDDRYQTATEVRKELQSFLRDARPVDSSGLAELLEAYFPVTDASRDTAITELSFSDEGNGETTTTVRDEVPPDDAIEQGTPPHTMVMQGEQGEQLAAAFRRAQLGAAASQEAQPAALASLDKGPGNEVGAIGQGLLSPPVLAGPPPWMIKPSPSYQGQTPMGQGPDHDRREMAAGLSGPFFVSMLIGLPLGVGFGLLVYWLLTR